MGLTRTLCKLSYNKNVDVECWCSHGNLIIKIKEAWTGRELTTASYNLETDIDQQTDVTEKLRQYFGKKDVDKKKDDWGT